MDSWREIDDRFDTLVLADCARRACVDSHYKLFASAETLKSFVAALLCAAMLQNTVASWYGSESGHKTASGETFNPNKLTAASWFYPFGTLLQVTNLRNNKCVVVRVNDRGPAKRLHRGIDLSERAATLLGYKRDGVANVNVQRVR